MIDRRNGWIAGITDLFLRNWITLIGASLTTASAFLILAFIALELFTELHSPYVGILTFMILPGFFVGGLLLIPIGAWWERRRRRMGGDEAERFPRLDFNQPRTRRAFLIVMFLTGANLFIMSLVTYRGVEYMDSVQFCGQVCHTVMQPEFTAYTGSPHSRVDCVECHIGPGAPWFVKAKLSGVRQVFAVALDTYSKPIPTPVHNLRPSQDTCEQCHWPKRFTGDRVFVNHKYSEDEENTALKTVMLMHIGGGGSEHPGIHSWHIDPEVQTSYLPADEEYQEIAMVRVTKSDGEVVEYWKDDGETDRENFDESRMRTMDCIDCHNRPTHTFQMPDEAIDEALFRERIDRSLPYVKKHGLEALETVGEALGDPSEIGEHIRAAYRAELGDEYASREDAIETAISELQTIYNRNVFPEMNVTWGTYPNNIGHTNFPGCFRCHDDQHTSADGQTISQDCTACHTVLAWDEEDPDIINQLGL